jgi:hypothetical protein
MPSNNNNNNISLGLNWSRHHQQRKKDEQQRPTNKGRQLETVAAPYVQEERRSRIETKQTTARKLNKSTRKTRRGSGNRRRGC